MLFYTPSFRQYAFAMCLLNMCGGESGRAAGKGDEASKVKATEASEIGGEDGGTFMRKSEPAKALMVRIEPEKTRFAEPFDLIISIVRQKGERLSLPSALPEKKSLRQSGEIQRRLISLSPADGGDQSWFREEIRIPFLVLDFEDVETPAFILTSPDGETIDVPALPVQVVAAHDLLDGGPAFDPTKVELAQARTHHQFTVSDTRPMVVLMGFLLSISAILLWRFGLKKIVVAPPVTEMVSPQPLKTPAHIIALERLDALLAEGLLQKGEVAPFVTRLMNEVLRDYLEQRFTLPAGKRTTREICEDLLTLSAPGLDVGLSKQIMEDADLVKFARAGLPVATVHQMAGRVRALIEATQEKIPPGELS